MHFVPAYPVRRCSSCRRLHWSVTVIATPPHRMAKHRQCCHVDHVVDYRSSIIIIIFSGISFVVQSFVCYLTQVNCVVYVASMRAVRVHCADEELATANEFCSGFIRSTRKKKHKTHTHTQVGLNAYQWGTNERLHDDDDDAGDGEVNGVSKNMDLHKFSFVQVSHVNRLPLLYWLFDFWICGFYTL